MTSFLCELLFSCLLAAPGAKSIDELAYGTALYHYYQQDYAAALVDVMVAQSQERIGGKALEFELAKGSFAFQEGMYRQAADVFGAVDENELTELDRLRLAFHLSREHYRQGDWANLETQLARLDAGLHRRGRNVIHPEVSFMRAEAALARADTSSAEAALGELTGKDETFLAYGLFNLGVASRAQGDDAGAGRAFTRLAELEASGEEASDVVQRGRLALAVMARRSGRAVDAREVLGTLPGEGRYRDLALASYGNLAMESGDHELAARIWLTLLEQPGWSPSRAMAHLGLPMSLEKVASMAHALDRYHEAERAFSRRLADLGEAAARVDDPVWIGRLLDAFADPDPARRARDLGRLDQGLGYAWLEWLSGEDLHRTLVEWRELDGMSRWLSGLPSHLAALEEVTVERRRRTAEAGLVLDDQVLPRRLAELGGEVEQLRNDLTKLERQPARPEPDWMRRLADDVEQALIERLAALSDRLARHDPPDRARLQARIDRLMGVVFWQIADHKTARVQVLAGRLKENRALLADVRARLGRLADAEAPFAAGVEANYHILRRRADAVTQQVAVALDVRRRVISQALERGLEQELARTRQYLLTARIAIARATDRIASAEAGGEGEGS